MKHPEFGQRVMNTSASVDNPHKYGYFVEVRRRTGRMNRGTWYRCTDKHGNFWETWHEAIQVISDDYVQPESKPPEMIGDIKVGDFCSFIYGQPGNDRTYGVIVGIRDNRAVLYDPTFGIEALLKPELLTVMTPEELSPITIGTLMDGTVHVLQLLEKARGELIS